MPFTRDAAADTSACRKTAEGLRRAPQQVSEAGNKVEPQSMVENYIAVVAFRAGSIPYARCFLHSHHRRYILFYKTNAASTPVSFSGEPGTGSASGDKKKRGTYFFPAVAVIVVVVVVGLIHTVASTHGMGRTLPRTGGRRVWRPIVCSFVFYETFGDIYR